MSNAIEEKNKAARPIQRHCNCIYWLSKKEEKLLLSYGIGT